MSSNHRPGIGKLVIGISGHTCAGKDTFAAELTNCLETTLGDPLRNPARRLVTEMHFSDSLREILTEVSAERTSRNFANLTYALRRNLGDDVLARILRHKTELVDSPIVIWNGLRQLSDVIHLRQFRHTLCLFISASEQERFERFRMRARDGATNVLDLRAQWEATRQIERDIAAVAREADRLIENDGRQLDAFVSRAREMAHWVARALPAAPGHSRLEVRN